MRCAVDALAVGRHGQHGIVYVLRICDEYGDDGAWRYGAVQRTKTNWYTIIAATREAWGRICVSLCV